jgi:PAS domain S-box-containing protein
VSTPLTEALARELYEHAPCGYMSALSDGTVVLVNQTLLNLTGYSREALLGKQFRDLLSVPARIFYDTHYDPLLRMQGFVREMAVDFLCADGRLLPVLLHSVQRQGAPGQLPTVWTTVVDATERRSYERELLQAQRRAQQLSRVVETSADAILIATPEGRIQTWNAGAERLFGYSSAEAIGSTIRQLIVPPEYTGEFEQLMEQVRSGREAQLETVRARKDGTRVDVSLSLAPHIEPPGEVIAISAIIRDIRERRRVESRLRRAEQLQAVATLAGGVAHEVNNQMAVVLGFGDFVLKALGGGHPQSSDVQAIIDAGGKVARITRQLLAFSRQLPMVGQQIELPTLVDQLAPKLAATLDDDKQLLVRIGRAPASVFGDPEEIEQALVQLTINARDAIGRGGEITLVMEVVRLTELDTGALVKHETPPSGDYGLISISDNGSGMDRATLDRAFEPFFTTKPFGQGTGLGLAMVHGIIKQHGGHISVSSEPGRGTTVRVYLPLVPSGTASTDAAHQTVHEAAGAPALFAPEFR